MNIDRQGKWSYWLNVAVRYWLGKWLASFDILNNTWVWPGAIRILTGWLSWSLCQSRRMKRRKQTEGKDCTYTMGA